MIDKLTEIRDRLIAARSKTIADCEKSTEANKEFQEAANVWDAIKKEFDAELAKWLGSEL